MNQFQKANHKCYGDNQNRNVKNQDNQNIHECCGIMILGLQEVSIHIIAFAYYTKQYVHSHEAYVTVKNMYLQ